MRRQIKIGLLTVLALILGAVAGFFLVAVSLFADGSENEKIVMLAITVGVFAALGGVLGWFSGRAWPVPGLALVLPPVGLALVFGEEPVLTAAFAFCSFAAGLGASALAGLSSRRA